MTEIRTGTAILTARIIRLGLRLLGKGATALPGHTAIRIQPSILAHLVQGQRVIAITGTNGKTTTTHMISEAMRSMGYEVVTNVSGANLASGLVTSLLDGKAALKRAQRDGRPSVCVLEVDEAAFAKNNRFLQPVVQVVTNLFRDQLDRFGEITYTRDLIAAGLDSAAGAILLNADDSMVASLAKGREERVYFFGIDGGSMECNSVTEAESVEERKTTADASYCFFCRTKYEYRGRSFGHLGDYCCPDCGFERNAPDFTVAYQKRVISEENGRTITPSDTQFPVELSYGDEKCSVKTTVPGLHNFYNLLAAAAACKIFGEKIGAPASLETISRGAQTAKPAFGRMEKIQIGDKFLCFLLIKNPVSMERALSFISEVSDMGAAYFLLNSNDADGRDVSWLWDVDFEARRYPERVFVSGERYGDMYLRLVYAGVERDSITCAALDSSAELVDTALAVCKPGECLYVMPNYTSMLYLRKILAEKYSLKAFWK